MKKERCRAITGSEKGLKHIREVFHRTKYLGIDGGIQYGDSTNRDS